jgi:Cu/Ag efflux pump CusA
MGAEPQQPIAVVVVGGTLSAMALTGRVAATSPLPEPELQGRDTIA